jgi:hypothetical protein
LRNDTRNVSFRRDKGAGRYYVEHKHDLKPTHEVKVPVYSLQCSKGSRLGHDCAYQGVINYHRVPCLPLLNRDMGALMSLKQ